MSNNYIRLTDQLEQRTNLINRNLRDSSFIYNSTEQLIDTFGLFFFERLTPSPIRGESEDYYKNCFNIVFDNREYTYCEGYAIYNEIESIVTHAWLINKAFHVIDPTWSENGVTKPLYYGIPFNRSYVIKFAHSIQQYGILENDYRNNYQFKREGFPPGAVVCF